VDGAVGVLAFSSGQSWLHALNLTAGAVWACCDGSAPLWQIIDDLADVWDTDRATVAHDVVECVRQLGGAGLLEGAPSINGGR